jgi:hypothetical protein
VHKALTPTVTPPVSHDSTYLHTIYVRDRNATLLEDKSGGFRNEGIHFVNYGSPIAFWATPLAGPKVGSSSVCWECEIPDEDIDEALITEEVVSMIHASCVVFYRQYFFYHLNTPALANGPQDILPPGSPL